MTRMSPLMRIGILISIAVALFYAFPNTQYARVEAANDAQTRIDLGKPLEGDVDQAQDWPNFLSNSIVNLGLDLRGGVHLVAQVEFEGVYEDYYNNTWVSIREILATDTAKYGEVSRVEVPNGLGFTVENTDKLGEAVTSIETELEALGADGFEYTIVDDKAILTLSDSEKAAINKVTMAKSVEIVRRRIDEAGTKEPTIQQQGDDRISIDVPGIASVDEVLNILGKTAKLSLHGVNGETSDPDIDIALDEIILPGERGIFYRLDRAAVVTGDMIVDAQLGYDESNRPSITFRLNSIGAKAFGDYTANHIGSPFAIVLDGKVLSAPTIQSYIPGGSAQITGDFTVDEATTLAGLLRAGALPAELTILDQLVVGPDLGQDSIRAGAMASVIALVLVCIYMIFSYRLYGIFASVSLIINLVFIIAALSVFGSTLTLPGIAGIVLTVGMAVDANVLIFERIREEFIGEKTLIKSVGEGFRRAFTSIVDANVTTFIAAIVLYVFGAGPVRGFAITLMIGIITSVFTAIFVTRLMINTYVNAKRPTTLSYNKNKKTKKRQFDFMAIAKWAVRASLIFVIGSWALFGVKGMNYGIDFRGGTMLEMSVDEKEDIANIRSTAESLNLGDVSVTTASGAEEGRQNYFVRISSDGDIAAISSEDFATLENGLKAEFPSYEFRGQASIGGAISGELIQSGLLAIGITLFAIGIYIWMRFEWTFSTGAIIALVHDVSLTIGIFALLGITFDLAIVAAILAIIGYSLNDTVIVYDRIREKIAEAPDQEFPSLINRGINETLTRTLQTSGTTLVAVGALYFLGGSALEGFSFAMIWGVLVGTYSSIFIASPVLIYLSQGNKPSDKPKSESKFSNVDA